MRNRLLLQIASMVEDGQRTLKVMTGSGDKAKLAKDERVIPRELVGISLGGRECETLGSGLDLRGAEVAVRTTTEEGRVRIMRRSWCEIGDCSSSSTTACAVVGFCASKASVKGMEEEYDSLSRPSQDFISSVRKLCGWIVVERGTEEFKQRCQLRERNRGFKRGFTRGSDVC